MLEVALEPFLSSRDWIAPLATRFGFQARLDEDITSTAALFALVRAGFGNAVMAGSYEPLAPEGVRLVPIEGEVSRQQLAYAVPVERPAVRLFLALAADLMASPQSEVSYLNEMPRRTR
jgi:DNA-binding transcriptional LysR family regulator